MSTPENPKKQSYQGLLWTWLILTVVGVLIGIYGPAHLMPRSMSNNMDLTILTTVVFTVAAAPVAAGVYAAALFMLRHWAHRGDDVPSAAPPIRDSATVVTSWVIVSVLLTVFLLVWGLGALAEDNTSNGKDPLVVDVMGQQWVWTFSYPGTGVSSNQLYLPLDREVEFRITSEDVTHGFWIANMGVQVDANPGTITELHTTPNKLGLFDIRCTQFCGLNHAFMVTVGHVITPSQFSNWLTAQAPQA